MSTTIQDTKCLVIHQTNFKISGKWLNHVIVSTCSFKRLENGQASGLTDKLKLDQWGNNSQGTLA